MDSEYSGSPSENDNKYLEFFRLSGKIFNEVSSKPPEYILTEILKSFLELSKSSLGYIGEIDGTDLEKLSLNFEAIICLSLEEEDVVVQRFSGKVVSGVCEVVPGGISLKKLDAILNGNLIQMEVKNPGGTLQEEAPKEDISNKSSFFSSDYFLETSNQDSSFSVDFFEMLFSLSSALDVINPALSDHHHRVAYIAASIANELGLSPDEVTRIFQASLLHDLGSIELANRLSLLKFEDRSPQLHSILGSTLLSYFAPFSSLAPLVRYHHVHWKNGEGKKFQGNPVPLGSHIIHLADRIAVLVNSETPILDQVPHLTEKIIQYSGGTFAPDFVDGFLKIAKKEAFWLDLASPQIKNILKRQTFAKGGNLGLEGLIELSRFFAIVIDTRSHFTATHSTGVSKSAMTLGKLMGLPQSDCQKLEISGYLHDLGKLAVPREILEKNGKLTDSEFLVIRGHPYHTYNILREVEGLEEITQWASFHHETLSGTGYPFRILGKDISLGARIVAVADIFTALTEERPYRAGLPREKVVEIMNQHMERQTLDPRVVSTLMDNFQEVNERRQEEQFLAANTIKDHWKIGKTEEPSYSQSEFVTS